MTDAELQQLQANQTFATRGDIIRLEDKVDRLVKVMDKLIIFEERQATQALAVGELRKQIEEVRKDEIQRLEKELILVEKRLEKATQDLEKKVDMWIQRGIAVWFMVGTAITVYSVFFK